MGNLDPKSIMIIGNGTYHITPPFAWRIAESACFDHLSTSLLCCGPQCLSTLPEASLPFCLYHHHSTGLLHSRQHCLCHRPSRHITNVVGPHDPDQQKHSIPLHGVLALYTSAGILSGPHAFPFAWHLAQSSQEFFVGQRL